MDCHRCENLRYGGCSGGRCVHPGHKDVKFVRRKAGDNSPDRKERPYNKQICPDFKLKKLCSNCRYWERGEYFADGETPSRKGRCSLRCQKDGKVCRIWKPGKTSWKKRRNNAETDV